MNEWGQIDILVNNAEIFNFALFEDQTLADTRCEFEVNYFDYVRLIHAALPYMRERNEGIIHNTSSGAGLVGHPELSGYARHSSNPCGWNCNELEQTYTYTTDETSSEVVIFAVADATEHSALAMDALTETIHTKQPN